MNGEAISPLRRRMIEDMTVRKLVEKTQKDYIHQIKGLTIFSRPLARYCHGPGSEALPAASDQERRPPAEHQRPERFGPLVATLTYGGVGQRTPHGAPILGTEAYIRYCAVRASWRRFGAR
jgi:hypothetical protein